MKEKIRFFFIISTILRSYLHYFILLECSIKMHDVIKNMYHLNTLDLFHFFFLFRLFWWRIDTRIFIMHIIFLWYCTHELQIGLKIPIACTCVDIQIKGWISKVNTFNTFLQDISHLYKKTGSVSPSTKKSNHYLYTKYSRKNPHWQTRSTFSLYKFKSSINSDDHSKRK